MRAGTASLGAYLIAALLAAAIGWRLWDGYRRFTEPANDFPRQSQGSTPPPSGTHVAVDAIAGWHLFGSLVREPAGTPEPRIVDAPATRLNLQLLGMLSSKDSKDARAIIGTPGQPEKHYGIGDELPGGATLAAVRRDHVLLDRNGRYEKLALTRDENGVGTAPAQRDGPSGSPLRRPQRPGFAAPGARGPGE